MSQSVFFIGMVIFSAKKETPRFRSSADRTEPGLQSKNENPVRILLFTENFADLKGAKNHHNSGLHFQRDSSRLYHATSFNSKACTWHEDSVEAAMDSLAGLLKVLSPIGVTMTAFVSPKSVLNQTYPWFCRPAGANRHSKCNLHCIHTVSKVACVLFTPSL